MLRRVSSLFSALRTHPAGTRPARAPQRPAKFRPGLEALETRLTPSSVPLHVAGNQLRDAANTPVVLRGVNIISLEWRPDGDNVLQAVDIALHDWHANLLRLPVNQDFWFGHDQAWTGGESGDGGAAYRELVDQVINVARANNAYVLLDLHWSDMGNWGSSNGQHFLPDDNSTVFWQDAAPRYANDPAVLFDPYNEPHFASDQPSDADFALWRDGGWVNETGEFFGWYHSPGMQGLIDTIRATGANNIVTPEGLNWGSNLTGVLTGYALSDPAGNLMYQSHLYPNKLADDGVASSVEAVARDYPIYVGEWGSGGTPGWDNPGAAQSNRDMLAYLDSHPNFSWTAWALTPDLGGEYNLLTDWNGAATSSDYGALVKDSLAAHADGRVVVGPAPGGAVSATAGFADTDDWGSGFTGYITVTNTGNTSIHGWTLAFDFSGNIYETWDAQVVSHQGSHYVVRNADWDADIAAGQSVRFGFNADWNGAQAVPTNYALNGVALGGRAVNPAPGLSATAGFADVDDWGSGFTGYITVTNTGRTAVSGWTLEFDFRGNIYEMWDAQILSHVGDHYVIQNADWDADIAAGQSVSFGFNADWADAQSGPGNYILNGVAIAGR